ncbi:MAG: DUF4190 domain-containing protein [Bacteroidetes bacterium]|nr:DUF4190 domain-containing protein [Bacteroidota bacterium]
MQRILLFLSFLLLIQQPSFARITLRQHQKAIRNTGNTTRSIAELHTHWQNFGPRKKRHHPNDEDRYYNMSQGITAFTSVFLSLASFVAFALTGVEFFIFPALIFAGISVVLGAVGMKRMKPGYALAGMILGFLELIVGIVALASLPPM